MKKILLFISCSFLATTTYSFGVDVCFNNPATTPLIQNCINIVNTCRTSNLPPAQQLNCRLAALSESLSGLSGSNNIIGGRSLLHSDSTYLMAQIIGFNAWQAYQMMIYSEATDQSDYVAFDQQGKQILSDDEIANCRKLWGKPEMPSECLIITQVMSGIYKFNSTSGGMLLHLHARYSSDGTAPPPTGYPTDYFNNQNSSYEQLLSNLRQWVFGERTNACAAGITQDPSTPGSPCASSDTTLASPMSFFAPGFSRLAIPFSTILGELIINELDSGNTMANDTSFQQYITPHEVAYAKFGIFIHALGDRISHHMCSDNSYFYKEEASNNYTSSYSDLYCAQGSHFLWHAWEQGTIQSDANLASEHQTLKPALEAVYDQLYAYALYKNISINRNLNKEKIINNLIGVLQIDNPAERLNNMILLTEGYGKLPLPKTGYAKNYSLIKWLQLAGAPVQ